MLIHVLCSRLTSILAINNEKNISQPEKIIWIFSKLTTESSVFVEMRPQNSKLVTDRKSSELKPKVSAKVELNRNRKQLTKNTYM